MQKEKGRFPSAAPNIWSKLFRRSGFTSPASEVTQAQGAQSTTSDQLAEGPSSQNFLSTVAEKGWEGLKIALRVLEQSSKAFPPLGMAVSGLIVAIDVIEGATANKEDFSQMADQITRLAHLLSRYNREYHEPDILKTIRDRVDEFSSVLEAMLAHINAKLSSNVVIRILDGSKDAQEIVRCLRTISLMVQQFQLDMALSTESKMHGLATQLENMENNSVLQNLKHVRNASFKSEEEKRCMPGTRVAILARLFDWAADPHSPPVFWLSGMAGTGKSAITGSFAELLDGVGILGASFFCSRDAVERRNVKRIIPTIAHSLARCHPKYRSNLLAILEKDPDIGHYGLQEQFAALIVTPLISLECDCKADCSKIDCNKVHCKVIRNRVIVIDALDECEAPHATRNLLTAFIRQANLPIKILFSSRPEPQMRENLDDPGLNGILRLHDVEEDVVMRDINLYLENRLTDFARRSKHELENWPSRDDLQTILHLCGAFFIYAFTVVEYITAAGDPKRRLASLVASRGYIQANRRYSTVDQLYAFIMQNAFDAVEADERDALRDILSTILFLQSPLPLKAIADLLDRDVHPEGDLKALHSVVNIPSKLERPVAIFHASFADYMTDQRRSSQFFVDPVIGNAFLASMSLQCMNRHLRRDIGPLPEGQSHYTLQSLGYSCLHWAAHLASCSPSDQIQVLDLLADFVNEHFLHWMELLGWIGRLEDALTSLRIVSAILKTVPKISTFVTGISIQDVVEDALQFIPYSFEIVKSNPTEIYRSALVWLPLTSVIRKLYEGTRLSQEIPQVEMGLVESWAACDHVLRHRKRLVLHAEFSPDSSRVVSATLGGGVRIWNAVIREPLLLLQAGHTASFSPDGSQIVSGLSGGTLGIWDARDGTLMLVLKGHLHAVVSAAFSADGSQVVSASKDRTIRIWDTTTGNTKQLLKRGQSQIRSAAFSADGSRIVSARSDGTVDIWNTASGLMEQVLVGHSDEVNSAVFFKDDSLVVSASDDKTVRVWGMLGETKQVLKHPSRVLSVAISLDGIRIVSASRDRIVRVWNTETGKTERELKGHTDEVNFASFSKDGSQIISASDDGTVRIWSAHQRGLLSVPELDIQVDDMDFLQENVQEPSQKHQAYFLSDDNSQILHRSSDLEELACWIPAQYRDIVGRRLSITGSTVSFTLASGQRCVVRMDPRAQEIIKYQSDSLLGGPGRRAGGISLLEDTWDEVVSKSMADRKLALYGSYKSRR